LPACSATARKIRLSHVGEPDHIHNFGGAFGAWIADLAFYLCGVVAYALPLLLLTVGAVILRGAIAEAIALEPTLRLVGGVAFFIGGTGLAYLHIAARAIAGGERRHHRPRRRRLLMHGSASSARRCSCSRCSSSR
jgi:hypothetical protein